LTDFNWEGKRFWRGDPDFSKFSRAKNKRGKCGEKKKEHTGGGGKEENMKNQEVE